MATFVAKVTDGEQVRRLVLPSDADFAKTARAAYVALGTASVPRVLSYVDEDGDTVSVRTDADVAAAVAWAQASGNTLKLNVVDVTDADAGADEDADLYADEPKPEAEAESAPEVEDKDEEEESEDESEDEPTVELDLGPLATALPTLLEQVGQVAPEVAVQLSEAVDSARQEGATNVPQLVSALLPNVEVILRDVAGSSDQAPPALDGIATFVRDILGGGASAAAPEEEQDEDTSAAAAAAAAAATPTTPASDGPVHRFVRCDVCGTGPLRGVRYKCSVCPDWDACESCEATNPHPQHALLKINTPQTTYRHYTRAACPQPPRAACGQTRGPCGQAGPFQGHPLLGMMRAAHVQAQRQHALRALQAERERRERAAAIQREVAARRARVVNFVETRRRQHAAAVAAHRARAAAAAAAAAEQQASATASGPAAAPRYADEQETLSGMGFADTAANERLLARHNGDLRLVVRDLLGAAVTAEHGTLVDSRADAAVVEAEGAKAAAAAKAEADAAAAKAEADAAAAAAKAKAEADAAAASAAAAAAADSNSTSAPAPRYAEQQAQLAEMGFRDTAANERVLARHNGDLRLAVRDLLGVALSYL